MFAPTHAPDRLTALTNPSLGSTSLQTRSTGLATNLSSSLSSPLQQELSFVGSSDSLTSISSSLIPILLTDDAMSTARNLGAISGTITRNNFVGASDTQDYYRINLSGISGNNFNLSMTGLSADADVQLLDSFGNFVASSTRGSTNNETINLSGLAGGDYYVRVYQYLGDTNYSLNLSTDRPSNLLAAETNIGSLSGTRVFGGAISNNNTADVYQFSVTNTSIWIPFSGSISIPTNVNITLSGLSSDADVRLIRDVNSNGIVDSGDVISSSTRGSNYAEWISSTLQTGSYLVQVNQWSGSTNYHLSVSTGDWYSSNLSDAGVIGEARYYGADGGFSRNDMMAILRETKSGSTVDATELADLRELLSDRGGMMPEYVRNLTHKVINSDPANPRSGIGNLFAGSSSTQMENLIGKWFLGNDRPTAAGTYQYASGSLFQGGINVSDINQGSVGDCYFLSTLGSFASDRPSVINNMFIDNGDGTFTVRFYNGGNAEYVTVDRYLPTDAWGRFIYANNGNGSTYTDVNNELWVALAEKAYAQLNESGWIGQDNTNSYAGIDGGWMAPVMRQITGMSASSQSVTAMTQTQLINLVNSATTPITAGFVSGGGFGVVDRHAYTITSYNASTGRFHLNNPWGDTHADVTWSELRTLNAQIEWSNV